jgi:predicted nucleotidyltransferase
MRLTAYERNAIKESVHRHLPDARVLLYGSRTDDSKRGGDIDLLILSTAKSDHDLYSDILCELYDRIGEQKIDLLLENASELSNFAKIVIEDAQPV